MRIKLLKVAAFLIFPASIMVLFEIHQRFKVTFLTNCAFPLKSRKQMYGQIFIFLIYIVDILIQSYIFTTFSVLNKTANN